MAIQMILRAQARIALFALLAAGLWLALKPTLGDRRLTFLPIKLAEYIDFMDFWFNLIAFALLGLLAWVAFGSSVNVVQRSCVIIAAITTINVFLEMMQLSIPGRTMDGADVWAGLLGCVAGILGGQMLTRRPLQKECVGTAPRVLFLDQTGHLGGAELMLLDIVAARPSDSEVILFQDGDFRHALERAGVKTVVFAMGEEAASVDKQAGLNRILRSIPGLLGLVLQIKKSAWAFDVVYANTAKALIVGGPAAWLAGRPLVFHLHDIVEEGHFSPLNRRLLILAANFCADAVIANSEATKAAFIASGGKARFCSVIPNGFRIQDIQSTHELLAAKRLDLGVPNKACLILMAGRLAPWKGQHVLLAALKSVPHTHVVLLGDALFTAEDREYAKGLHRQAEATELKGRVHFVGFQSETRDYFEMSDVVVHASVSPEPFGRVIVEGMLAGKTVIATRAGGAAEILQHEKTGLLVTPGDVQDLANALCRVREDPELTREMGQRAKQVARTTYCLGTVQKQIEAVITKAANRRAGEAECVS